MIDCSVVAMLATVLVTLAISFYLYFRIKFSYWQRRGVPVVKPIFPYGNLKGISKIAHPSQFFRPLFLQPARFAVD